MDWNTRKGRAAMMPYKILVVDDEDNIRTLVQTMLKQEGRQVVLAARGKEAIAMFKKERPNLTILDIDMPDIDGITVLREIRTIDPLARVMVFTGGGEPSSGEPSEGTGGHRLSPERVRIACACRTPVPRFAVLEMTPSPTPPVRP